jgi:hypothetical protein
MTPVEREREREQDGEMLIRYRLDELRKELDEFKNRSEGWHSALGAGNTHLQSEFLSWRMEVRDQYVLQKDADVRHGIVNTRLDEVARQQRLYDQEVAKLYSLQRDVQTLSQHVDKVETDLLRRLDALEKRGREFTLDHEEVHKESREEHRWLLRWVLAALASAVLALAQAILRFIPGPHA